MYEYSEKIVRQIIILIKNVHFVIHSDKNQKHNFGQIGQNAIVKHVLFEMSFILCNIAFWVAW